MVNPLSGWLLCLGCLLQGALGFTSHALPRRPRLCTSSAAPPAAVPSQSLWCAPVADDVVQLSVADDAHTAEDLSLDELDGDSSNGSVWLARGTLLTVAALYGTNYSSIKVLQEMWDGDGAAAVRFIIAAVCTLPWLVKLPKEALAGGLQVGAFNAIGYLSQFEALHQTTASKTAFIGSLAVVAVPCFEALSGQASAAGALLPAMVATAGVMLLELGGLTPPNSGDLVALAQPLFFGLGYWRLGAVTKQWPGLSLPLVAAQSLAVAVVVAAYAFATHGLPTPAGVTAALRAQPALGGALVWTGIMTTVVSAIMETKALRVLSAAEATVLYSTEPLFATLFAAVLVGEGLGGWSTGAGAALILAACLWRVLLKPPAAAPL
ncbi:hypothetical protein JKP88DRAFT_266232 [Tribonema minus]|uniref:EamA domain-containing protein n=1 Tax=Tribonema minus TaxID=303371 RepID=A0A836CMZ2_9STRA|nr:hypothetical protein JKP88DRAFT_266232 [Tribonema minus]